jgi:hypothetical protein
MPRGLLLLLLWGVHEPNDLQDLSGHEFLQQLV